MRESPALKIDGLSKSFGENRVLEDLSIEISSGEVVFVIGPSGSGKSTLLRCINRLEEPTTGTIIVGGTVITGRGINLNVVRQDIGFVFQSFNLYPHMTALGNVTLALRVVRRMRKIDALRVGREALKIVGLAEKAASYPSELSGGQQQRVAIARALALEPKLMLFDEPTSALDPELVGEVLGTIAAMRERGMTMLIVSHEMHFARQAADRVIFMDSGKIVEVGSPERIFGNPQHSRTQNFLHRFMNS